MDAPTFPISVSVITALAAILILCLFKILPWKLWLKQKKKYPPIVSTGLNLIFNWRRLHDYMTELACKHGTHTIIYFDRCEVYISDPEIVEYVLKANFPNYGRGEYHHNIMKDLLGNGIFTVDGEKWRQQRKISSHEFSTKVLRDFSSAIFRENALKFAQIVSEAADSNQDLEVQGLLMKSTLDSVFKIMFGVDLDSMCGTNEEGAKFSHCFDEASAITLYRYVDVFWKIKRFLNVGSEARMRNDIKVIDEFVYKLIRNKTEQFHKSQEDPSSMKKGDILSRFLELNETEPKYLRDIILCFIIAGKDTTASTLSWFFYMMCKHPFIQENIAQEVMEATKCQEDSSIDEISTNITEQALDKMQFLQAALTETLRLYPAVPVDGKECFSDDTLPGGLSLKKGHGISYQPYAMGRMKSLWGDDANEFRPERWLDENGIFHQESPFKFTAFQGGPRICLGKEFAYRQMKILSAVLMTKFRFKLSDEQKAVHYRTMLTLQIDGGLYLYPSYRLRQKCI